MANNDLDGFKLDQRHGKARVRVTRVWRTNHGRNHFMVEWNVSISLISDCLNAYVSDDNSNIVATDTMKNTVVQDYGFYLFCVIIILSYLELVLALGGLISLTFE